MKKAFAVMMAAAMAASALMGSVSVKAAAAEGETFVFKHGFDLDYPPYSYIDDNGDTNGFDVEMAKAVCEYYGWEYEAVPFNWDAKDAELNAGSCDCIWSGFTMNGREDDYLWSKPYSDNTQMIMVAKDSGIQTLADLAGKAVGVQTSTSAYDLLNDEEGQAALAATFSSLEVYETYTIAFNDLKAGAIDAIAIDVTSGNFLMSNAEGYGYLEEELGSEQYAIGFRKDDTELCEKINAALDALAADGTFDAIGQKYPEIYDYLTLNKQQEAAKEEQAAEETAGTYKDGEYEGTGVGMEGDIQVKVTIKDGKIADIQVAHNETEGIGAAAMPEYVKQTIATNSLEIDGIAGATTTLRGYKDAVSRALAKALE